MIVFILAAGVGLSNAIIHFALGLRRPGSSQHVTFALMMLVTCPFQLIVARLAVATSVGEVIALTRAGVAAAVVIIFLFATFVLRYSGIKIRPAYAWAYVAISTVWLVYDLVAPFSLLYTSSAEARSVAPGAQPSILVIATSPIGLAWQAFNTLTVLWGVGVGGLLFRRGRRRQGAILVLGGSFVLMTVATDLLRNLFEWSWPYVGGFGIIGFSLLLSVELAIDFRDYERRLTEWVAAAVVLRDQLNTPLQTLRFGLEALSVRSDAERASIDRLQRAVTRLSKLGVDLRARPLRHRDQAR